MTKGKQVQQKQIYFYVSNSSILSKADSYVTYPN